jgi:hypothetical protein
MVEPPCFGSAEEYWGLPQPKRLPEDSPTYSKASQQFGTQARIPTPANAFGNAVELAQTA